MPALAGWLSLFLVALSLTRLVIGVVFDGPSVEAKRRDESRRGKHECLRHNPHVRRRFTDLGLRPSGWGPESGSRHFCYSWQRFDSAGAKRRQNSTQMKPFQKSPLPPASLAPARRVALLAALLLALEASGDSLSALARLYRLRTGTRHGNAGGSPRRSHGPRTEA